MSSTASALKLENVLYEKKGPIAYVTINRPEVLNALNAKSLLAVQGNLSGIAYVEFPAGS